VEIKKSEGITVKTALENILVALIGILI